MHRFAQIAAAGLLISAGALLAACANSAGGLITGATQDGDVPGGITNESPLARPMAVAWTSARAQRCGFYFDAAKLRASYLAYEAKQTSGDGLSKAEKAYDTTFKTTRDRVSSEQDYCTEAKSAAIKTDLQRHLAGDYSPRLPAAKKQESCGFFGCTPVYSDPLNEKKLWDDLERKKK
jgi:hypothetical protein